MNLHRTRNVREFIPGTNVDQRFVFVDGCASTLKAPFGIVLRLFSLLEGVQQ